MISAKKLKKKTGQSGGRIKVKETSTRQYDQNRPLFSLEYLDGNYCISRCEIKDKASFAEALRKLSQFTWQQLKLNCRHGLGYEKINQTSLKVSTPPIVTADTDIIAFRFNGLKPMVGFRKKDIFYIIWLDRNFSVYTH